MDSLTVFVALWIAFIFNIAELVLYVQATIV